jgi:Na+/melibiose symporter-like transporter
LQPDTVDYGEWKTGVRGEGASYSILSFTRKAGQGVGGAAASFTLGLGGYISGAATQTDAGVTSIKVAVGLVPAVAILIGALVMFAYPLTEDVYRRIVRETAGSRGGDVTRSAQPRSRREPGALRRRSRTRSEMAGAANSSRRAAPPREGG